MSDLSIFFPYRAVKLSKNFPRVQSSISISPNITTEKSPTGEFFPCDLIGVWKARETADQWRDDYYIVNIDSRLINISRKPHCSHENLIKNSFFVEIIFVANMFYEMESKQIEKQIFLLF